MTNLYTLDELAVSPQLLTALDLDELDAVLDKCRRATDTAKTVTAGVNALLERRYGDRISAAYKAEAKDTGTVHVLDGPFDLIVDRPKKVEWDQAKLAEAGDKIAEAGDDPHEYLDRKLSVSEAKFKAWPAHIRDVFEPARTLRPGALSIKIARREREAA